MGKTNLLARKGPTIALRTAFHSESLNHRQETCYKYAKKQKYIINNIHIMGYLFPNCESNKMVQEMPFFLNFMWENRKPKSCNVNIIVISILPFQWWPLVSFCSSVGSWISLSLLSSRLPLDSGWLLNIFIIIAIGLRFIILLLLTTINMLHPASTSPCTTGSCTSCLGRPAGRGRSPSPSPPWQAR